MYENDRNSHLNGKFPLKIAKISLQKQNFLGIKFPHSTFCPCMDRCVWAYNRTMPEYHHNISLINLLKLPVCFSSSLQMITSPVVESAAFTPSSLLLLIDKSVFILDKDTGIIELASGELLLVSVDHHLDVTMGIHSEFFYFEN